MINSYTTRHPRLLNHIGDWYQLSQERTETDSGLICCAKERAWPHRAVWIKSFYSRQWQDIQHECLFLTKLKDDPQPHLVTVLDVCQDAASTLHFVMEQADCDLWEYVNRFGSLSEEHTRRIMQEIAKAIALVFDLGYWYLDLSLENVLVFEENDVIKLTDFGSLIPVGEALDVLTDFCHGKALYYPTEIFQNHSSRMSKITSFSFGVVMFALLFGRLAFDQASVDNEDFLALSYGDVDDVIEAASLETSISVSSKASKLLCKLLCLEFERYDIKEILTDEWFLDAS